MLATTSVLLAGCASAPPKPRANATLTAPSLPLGSSRGGAYYEDDGPGANPPANLDRIPDAVPRTDPYASGPNKPYIVFGKEYVPDTSDHPYLERGIGSWYGRKFNGQRTSSGEIYDMYAMTAAHPTLPIPSYARVTNIANGRSVIVRINDRGPFHSGRVIDLSYAAAYKLGYARQGSSEVEVERLLPRDIAAGRYSAPVTASATAPLLADRTSIESSGAAATSHDYPTAIPAPPVSNPTVQQTTASTKRASLAYPDLPADLRPTDQPEENPSSGVVTQMSTPLTSPMAGDAHYLQLGAFHVQLGADDFMRHMARELEPSLASQLRIVASDRFYRVQLGPYANRSQAEYAAQRVRDDLGIVPLIVETP